MAPPLHTVLTEMEVVQGLDWAGTTKMAQLAVAADLQLGAQLGVSVSVLHVTCISTLWCLSFMKQEMEAASYFKA